MRNPILNFMPKKFSLKDGFEYGNSLTLLFLQTDSGLRLDQYFAAG